jgi:membrane glycosyltransferase
MTRRRLTVLVLNVTTFVALMWGLSIVLAAGGWTVIDVVIFVAFAFGAPWTVLGFWNAVIGLWLLHGVGDGVERVAPFAAAGHSHDPVTVRTAIFMTLRNEDPGRAVFRLKTVKQSVDATGQ